MTTAQRRSVYRYSDLRRLFNPESIAIYGVPTNPASMGAKSYANLRWFPGKSFAVNPKYQEIAGQVCYPSIKACPQVPDCVLIAVPRTAVEEAVLECAEHGVGGVVVLASGYADTGKPADLQAQQRLGDIARRTGIKIIGPNTMGFANFTQGAIVSFLTADMPRDATHASGIGLIAQSGGTGFGFGQAMNRGVAFSHIITMGNACDITIADVMAFMAEDPKVKCIACVFEGLSDPSQLMEAGELAFKNDKPVLLYKMGNSREGAAAAASHSGALAASERAYRAAAKRVGIVMLDDPDILIETAAFFAKVHPWRPRARGVAIMSVSGGATIMLADAAEKQGIALPQPSEALKETLHTLLPPFAVAKNPLDTTTMMNKQNTPVALDAFGREDQYGCLVYPAVHTSSNEVTKLPWLSAVSEQRHIPVCIPLISAHFSGSGTLEAAKHPRLPFFTSPKNCFAAIKVWHCRDDLVREREVFGPRQYKRQSPENSKAVATKIITGSDNRLLSEREAKSALAPYGVPVTREILAHSAEEAASAATSLGFPVVLKVESPDLPHKTEAGVVRLELTTAVEVIDAYHAILANANRVEPRPRLNGVLVQSMVSPGIEVMVGGKIDPSLGPLIIVGLGGIMVELIDDTALDLAPVTLLEAHRLLGTLKYSKLLTGYRGSVPVNLDKLADIIVRLSEFIDDQKDIVSELDVNPLICSGNGEILAVDALIVRRCNPSDSSPKLPEMGRGQWVS